MAGLLRQRHTASSLSDINITPFVDVVLVLLIIFMITAPVIQSGIEVDVPRTQVVREIAEEKLVVSIDREQKLYLQNTAVNVNELGQKIREQLLDPSRQSIYLRADQSVPFGTIAAVMDSLKLAGIQNISVVTQPLEQPRRR